MPQLPARERDAVSIAAGALPVTASHARKIKSISQNGPWLHAVTSTVRSDRSRPGIAGGER